MKSLKDFITEKCENIYSESLSDNENELINNDILVKEFLDKHIWDSKTVKPITDKVTIRKTAKGIIVDYTSGNGITYNYETKSELTSLTNGLFKFGQIEGDFYCPDNITSLEGGPDYVSGLFTCGYSNIKTLEGAPRYAKKFNCDYCKKLKSLKGGPDEVGIFVCTRCSALKSLEGAPKKVNDFDCSQCTKLMNLKGSPIEVTDSFTSSNCKNLKSLEGAPQKVGSSFSINDCPSVDSLIGSPKIVGANFHCNNTAIKTLKGCPKRVGGRFSCYNCKELTSIAEANCEEIYIAGCESLPEDVHIKKPAGVRKYVIWGGWRGRN